MPKLFLVQQNDSILGVTADAAVAEACVDLLKGALAPDAATGGDDPSSHFCVQEVLPITVEGAAERASLTDYQRRRLEASGEPFIIAKPR